MLLFVPETKGKTLEELDQVFGISTRHHTAWGLSQLVYFFRRYVLFGHLEKPVLVKDEMVEHDKRTFAQEKETNPNHRI